MAVSQLVGAKIHRREDPRLITGHGRFTDDLGKLGVLHLSVVRSPHAHARIRSIGLEAARKSPGVVAVFIAQDFNGVIAGPATHPVAPVFAPDKKTNPPRYPIAKQEDSYQGEPVAVVIAEFDSFDNRLTMWMSTQNPHWIRLFVSGALGMGEHAVRVISQDVGGGFGSKISPYPEDYLVPATAKMLGRPVKWTETRTESVQNAYAGRGQIYDVEACAKKDGTLLGMRVTQLLDTGAYIGTFGAFQTCACLLAGGAYKWKAISSRSIGILTNKITTDPYRGAGRPEATHLAERVIDLLAAELKMDPVELRRKNFPDKDEFPWTQNFGLVVDSGDYHGSLDKALKLAGYDQLRKEQAEARKHGRLIGIG